RVRHEVAGGSACAPRRDRASGVAIYQSERTPAPARALGASRDHRAGRLHRMDSPRKTSPSAAPRRAVRQESQGRDQRELVISHPDKILFPDEGITKGELASYYEMIAPVMVPHMRNRPVTMERYHRGIGAPGFFQKDVSKGFPSWLERVEVPKKDGTVHHALASDVSSLLWMANQNSITPHVWTSRLPDLDKPDVCVFDLDPAGD